jgi:uncharacterized membrane protein YoaT (DUF817 family)
MFINYTSNRNTVILKVYFFGSKIKKTFNFPHLNRRMFDRTLMLLIFGVIKKVIQIPKYDRWDITKNIYLKKYLDGIIQIWKIDFTNWSWFR